MTAPFETDRRPPQRAAAHDVTSAAYGVTSAAHAKAQYTCDDMTAFIGAPESLKDRWDHAFLQLHTAIDRANRELWGPPQAVAGAGMSGGGGRLPHGDRIQAAFGRHDVSGVQAYVGGAAERSSRALGADAYAMGGGVAFARQPDLFLAAHEAAHVVQQRGGVALSGGMGAAGDVYERHADEVASLVVSGKSAEAVLDRMAGGGSAGGGHGGGAVQRKETKTPTAPSLTGLDEDELKRLKKTLEDKTDVVSQTLLTAIDDRLRELEDSRPKTDLSTPQKTNLRKPKEVANHYTKRPKEKGYVTKTRLKAGRTRHHDVDHDKKNQDIDRDKQRKRDAMRGKGLTRKEKKREKKRINQDAKLKKGDNEKDAKKRHKIVPKPKLGGDLIKKGGSVDGALWNTVNKRLAGWLKRYNNKTTSLTVTILGYKLEGSGSVGIDDGIVAKLEGGASFDVIKIDFTKTLAQDGVTLGGERLSGALKFSATANAGVSASGTVSADANGKLKELLKTFRRGEQATEQANRAKPKVSPGGKGEETKAQLKAELSGFVGLKAAIGLSAAATWHKKPYVTYKSNRVLHAGFKKYLRPHLPGPAKIVLDGVLALAAKGEEALVNFVFGDWGAQGNVPIVEGSASVTGSYGAGVYGNLQFGWVKGGIKVDGDVGAALGVGLGAGATFFINIVEGAKLGLIWGGRLLTACLSYLTKRVEAAMPQLTVLVQFGEFAGDKLHDTVKARFPLLYRLTTPTPAKVGYPNEAEILKFEGFLEANQRLIMKDPQLKALVTTQTARRRTAIRACSSQNVMRVWLELKTYVAQHKSREPKP